MMIEDHKLSLLLIVLIAWLTHCISSTYGNDRITQLPGQPGSPYVSQFSGYITVNASHGRALFYWFIEAQSLPMNRPLLLWFNGGPGCSSIGYGAVLELGPLLLGNDGSLHFNEYAWNKEANILFVEFPAGVGFSYTKTPDDFGNMDDAITAEDNYQFLVKFLMKYPQFMHRAVYIGGESYAGHFMSQLAELVSDRNQPGQRKRFGYANINLRGFILGNPELDDYYDYKGILEYAWSHSVISNEMYYKALNACDFNINDWPQDCVNSMNVMWSQYEAIDMYNINAPKCLNNPSPYPSPSPLFHAMAKGRVKNLAGGDYDPCFEIYPNVYFNRPDVQRAMHATMRNAHSKIVKWQLCNSTIFNTTYNWNVYSVMPILQKLTKRALHIWIYSGDLDGRLPFIGSENFVEALQLPLRINWTTWFYNQQVAGRVIEYDGITFLTVRGAGHTVPLDKPGAASIIINSYLSGKRLPTNK